ncbi:MAG TPA: alanine--glyoxylate aminotransferase family protein, partial [Roseobacter sp.]|nr:alanine--glyoxylate aminotransferase family protein [Roseobacter sp.]
MSNHPNLSQGRGYLAIPGPSVMPEAVLNAMHRPAPNIYAGELVDMMPPLMQDLRSLAGTKHHVAMYIGNGHAAWEAALSNVIAPGDKVLVPATGRFGIGWGDTATGLGADVEIMDFGLQSALDSDRIAERLR